MQFVRFATCISAAAIFATGCVLPSKDAGSNAGDRSFLAQPGSETASIAPPDANHDWSQPTGSGSVSPPQDNAFLASCQRAVSSAKDNLTLKPKVIPPDDPISLSREPQSVGPDLHREAAKVYESQGNFSAAANFYEKALAIDPSDYRSLIGLARLSDREGDFQRAEQLYVRATTARPDIPAAFNDLGLSYARRGNLEAASQNLEQAVRVKPNDPLYRNNLAMVLVDLGQFDSALVHLTEAHGQAAAHYNLGFLLANRQRWDLAREHFQVALQLDPGMQSARQMLARIDASTMTR